MSSHAVVRWLVRNRSNPLRLLLGHAVLILAVSQTQGQPAQVIVIRHAEKPSDGNELSLSGHERAAALALYFTGAPDVMKFGALEAIYAQSPKHESSSVRPLQTVQPLADALKLTVNQSFVRDDYAAMVHEILDNNAYQGQSVLVCWEHKVIPDIAAALGVPDGPHEWPSDSFDRTWIITFESGDTPKLVDLPQKLMYGDSDE